MAAPEKILPIRLPDRAARALGQSNLGYTPVEGLALATNEDDGLLILIDNGEQDIVVGDA